MLDRELLRDNLRIAPEQPATALWRAIELGHLLRRKALPVDGRGLDLGCGNGLVTGLVRERSGARWEELVGVDSDPREAALARESGIYDAVHESPGDAIQVADGAFDFVFSNSVLEHVDELEPTVREVGRVLRPDGLFVFTVPSTFFPENLGRPGPVGRVATGARDVASYRAAIDRRLAHRRYLTLDEWRATLGSAGLELKESSGYLTRAETRRWALISNLTGGLLVRVTGGKRSPIELQRELRLRRSSPPFWLRAIGRTIGQLGALGLRADDRSPERGSGVLVVAQKTGG